MTVRQVAGNSTMPLKELPLLHSCTFHMRTSAEGDSDGGDSCDRTLAPVPVLASRRLAAASERNNQSRNVENRVSLPMVKGGLGDTISLGTSLKFHSN
jgi:hypothetical protein